VECDKSATGIVFPLYISDVHVTSDHMLHSISDILLIL